jgi:hypothetical protein
VTKEKFQAECEDLRVVAQSNGWAGSASALAVAGAKAGAKRGAPRRSEIERPLNEKIEALRAALRDAGLTAE